jgi:nicotinamide-nucleotide amidase
VSKPPRAGIVVTGTEVLTARIQDRNGPWLSEQLRARGFDVVHITICRDRPEDIRAQLQFMTDQKVDLVITTGGLGPTADDMTATIVSEFCGRETYLDEELFAKIEGIVRPYAERFGWDTDALSEGARKQAVIPRDTAVLGPAGTAPGLVVEPAPPKQGPTVVVLPGPPREMKSIWEEALETPAFRRIDERRVVFEEQMLRMLGVPEPEIARTLQEFDEDQGLDGLEVTTCLRSGEMEVLISHAPADHDRREALVALFRERHGEAIFSDNGETIYEQIPRLLDGRRLAVAESCTGGLLAQRLTDAPGASKFFPGGAVTYSNDSKAIVLGVDPEVLAERGAVSAEVAQQMAEGALGRFESEFAISVTGIAGPEGGTETKPVGTVFIHVAALDGRQNAVNLQLPGGRSEVRERSVVVALHALRRLLIEHS